jgi:hypothetical protein
MLLEYRKCLLGPDSSGQFLETISTPASIASCDTDVCTCVQHDDFYEVATTRLLNARVTYQDSYGEFP